MPCGTMEMEMEMNNVTRIDLHTHILPRHLPAFGKRFGYGEFIELRHECDCKAKMYKGDTFFREVEDNCFDASARINDCDRDNVDVQVLSTVPVMFNYWAEPKDTLEVAKVLNDDIAAIVKKHPTRFIGLGTLPMQSSELAIQELHRCMNELGFRGIQIGTHINGVNLDDASLFPIFQEAERLGAAIFVHPWDMMGADSMKKYWLPWLVGMPAETSRAICSFIFGGVFERLPKLRVAFAHGGGSFPSTIGRIQHGFDVRPDLCAVTNPIQPREYLGRFWLDSLVHDKTQLQTIVDLVGYDKVILGSDYPFPLGEHRPGTLIESMDHWSQKEKDKLLYRNAVEFLGLATGPQRKRSTSD